MTQVEIKLILTNFGASYQPVVLVYKRNDEGAEEEWKIPSSIYQNSINLTINNILDNVGLSWQSQFVKDFIRVCNIIGDGNDKLYLIYKCNIPISLPLNNNAKWIQYIDLANSKLSSIDKQIIIKSFNL